MNKYIMEDNVLIIVANAIRTNLLIQASQELSLLSPQQRIKINSESYLDLATKFGKYVITEQDVISSSPNKQCSNSFLESFEDHCASSQAKHMNSLESPVDGHIKSKKITFSQRKLGIPQQTSEDNCNTLISTKQKAIQKIATKEMRQMAKGFRYLYQKPQEAQPNAKLNKHYSELNLFQKKMRTETKKCLDRVYFSLNKKKEIVVKTKGTINWAKAKNNKSVIMLHQCPPVIDIQSKTERKKHKTGERIKHSSRSNNINPIYFDGDLNTNDSD